MYLIVIDGKEKEGAYAATNELGRSVLYIFEEEDDAIRFAMLMEQDGSPKMKTLEVDENAVIEACQLHEYDYEIFTSNDIVIPPQQKYTDFI